MEEKHSETWPAALICLFVIVATGFTITTAGAGDQLPTINCNFTGCVQIDAGTASCSIPTNTTQCFNLQQQTNFHFTFNHVPTVTFGIIKTGSTFISTEQNHYLFSTGSKMWTLMPNAVTDLFGTPKGNEQLMQLQDISFECIPIVWVISAATGNAYVSIQLSNDDATWADVAPLPAGRIPINATGFSTWSVTPNGPDATGWVLPAGSFTTGSVFLRVVGALGGNSSPVLGNVELICYNVARVVPAPTVVSTATTFFQWDININGIIPSPIPGNINISWVAVAPF